MLALADDAALARLVIAATRIPTARVECAFDAGDENHQAAAATYNATPARGALEVGKPTCARRAPPLGAALLGQHARGMVSFRLRTSHGRGV